MSSFVNKILEEISLHINEENKEGNEKINVSKLETQSKDSLLNGYEMISVKKSDITDVKSIKIRPV